MTDNDYMAMANMVGNTVGQVNATINAQRGLRTSDYRKAYEWWNQQRKDIYEQQKQGVEEVTKPLYEWQKTNDPKLTVAGMKAAGINPLMAYGGLDSALGGNTDIPVASAPDTVSGIASSAASMKQADIAGFLAMSQGAKNIAETGKIHADTKTAMTFNEFARDLYEGNAKSAQGNALLIDANTELSKTEAKKCYAEMSKLDRETDVLGETFNLVHEQVNLAIKEGRIKDEQIRNISQDTALKLAQTVREEFGITVDKKQIEAMGAQIYLATMQGSALQPAVMYGNWLSQNPYTANMKFSGDSWMSFYQAEDGRVRAQISTGNVYDMFSDNWKKSTKGKTGFRKGVAGALSVGQSAVKILTTNLGDMLGQVSGFVK